MSEQLKEALSAAMDNETDAFELRRVLDEASGDPELREQWHRMHMVRDVLRREPYQDGTDLRRRIWTEMEELDSLPQDDVVTDSDPQSGDKVNWLGRIAGAAVAVVVAALVVMNADLLSSDSDPVEIVQTESAIPVIPVIPVMYSKATEQDRLRVDGLRMQHYQQLGINNPGAVSFVRMATFRQSRRPVARSLPIQTAPLRPTNGKE
jgi:negative regulator of sigma E activity